MNYALVENAVVTNLIWLQEGNAGEFPKAIPLGDRPVQIGDAYQDGAFTRNGSPVLTPLEAAAKTIATLDGAVLDLLYQNLLRELEG